MLFESIFDDANQTVKECGFSELKMTSHEKDHDTFYEIIRNELDEKRKLSIKSVRESLCDLQKKEDLAFIFRAFQPEQDGNDAIAISNTELKISSRGSSCPRPRDIYAAATKLYRIINLFVYNVEHKSIEKHDYHHLYDVKQESEALNILAIPKKDVHLYIQLSISDPDRVRVFENQHSTCYSKRLLKRIDKVLKSPTECGRDSKAPQTKVVASFGGNFGLFRCISKAIYDTDSFFPFLKSLVIEYERSSEQKQVFVNLLTQTGDVRKSNEKKDLETHFDDIKNGTKAPGEGEMYAIATILCVKIFVYETELSEWKMYTPLSIPSTELLRKSFIMLQKSNSNDKVRFDLLVTTSKSCSCEIEEPKVWGDLMKLRKHLEEMKSHIIANRRSCCSRSHRHLQPVTEDFYLEITDERTDGEEDEELLNQARSQLSAEGRTIDEAETRRSLEYYISKELHKYQ